MSCDPPLCFSRGCCGTWHLCWGGHCLSPGSAACSWVGRCSKPGVLHPGPCESRETQVGDWAAGQQVGTDAAAALQASVSFLPSAHLGSPMSLHRCCSGPKQDFDVEGSPLPVLLFASRSFFVVFIPACHPAPAISFSRACLLPLPHSSVLFDSLARLVFLSSSASLSCPMVFTSALLALSSCPLLCPLLGGQHSCPVPIPAGIFLSMLSFLSALHSKLGKVKS